MNNKIVEENSIYQKTKKSHKATVCKGPISTQSGITLIALIITIIIMLILTTVTIKEVTGDGLIEKVKQAIDRYRTELEKEKTLLGEYENNANKNQTEYTDEEKYIAYVNECKYDLLSINQFNNNEGFTGNIALPYNYELTSINNGKFNYNDQITGIIIPNNVTTIGENAFWGCSSLSSITIPNSVTRIESGALGNTGLTNITIPASVTSISEWAFNGCNALTNITIDANNPNYSSENGIIFNKEKTTIIFALKTINNPNIPNSVTSIGESAFYACESLINITIPNSVTSIGASAFGGCSALVSITIPNSITSIEEGTFSQCTSLISVKIPSSVINIVGDAFSYCTSLTNITIDANNPNYLFENGIIYNKNKTKIIIYLSSNTTTEYTILNRVTSIGERAFYSCESLISITIPNSVTSIGSDAFTNCFSLANITIPSSVISIGSDAFVNCFSLASITLRGITYTDKVALNTNIKELGIATEDIW